MQLTISEQLKILRRKQDQLAKHWGAARLVQYDKEIARLEHELQRIQREVQRLEVGV